MGSGKGSGCSGVDSNLTDPNPRKWVIKGIIREGIKQNRRLVRLSGFIF